MRPVALSQKADIVFFRIFGRDLESLKDGRPPLGRFANSGGRGRFANQGDRDDDGFVVSSMT